MAVQNEQFFQFEHPETEKNNPICSIRSIQYSLKFFSRISHENDRNDTLATSVLIMAQSICVLCTMYRNCTLRTICLYVCVQCINTGHRTSHVHVPKYYPFSCNHLMDLKVLWHIFQCEKILPISLRGASCRFASIHFWAHAVAVAWLCNSEAVCIYILNSYHQFLHRQVKQHPIRHTVNHHFVLCTIHGNARRANGAAHSVGADIKMK